MAALAPEEILHRAAIHFAAGELRQAEPLLRPIDSQGFVSAPGLHLLGLFGHQQSLSFKKSLS
jgi:hypothetical protein